VDLKNAFSSIARRAILKALEHLCTCMMPWVRQAFQPAPLLVGREVVWSTLGVQQGYPLGPFLCGGHPNSLGRPAPRGALHRWYLDDRVFLGSVAEVEKELGASRQTLPPLGLSSTCGI